MKPYLPYLCRKIRNINCYLLPIYKYALTERIRYGSTHTNDLHCRTQLGRGGMERSKKSITTTHRHRRPRNTSPAVCSYLVAACLCFLSLAVKTISAVNFLSLQWMGVEVELEVVTWLWSKYKPPSSQPGKISKVSFSPCPKISTSTGCLVRAASLISDSRVPRKAEWRRAEGKGILLLVFIMSHTPAPGMATENRCGWGWTETVSPGPRKGGTCCRLADKSNQHSPHLPPNAQHT